MFYIDIRPFRYERVYLPLCKVADTPFHIQRDDILQRFKGQGSITDHCMSRGLPYPSGRCAR